MASMSSAQIVSATAIHNKLGLPGIPRPAFPRPEVNTPLMAASRRNTPDKSQGAAYLSFIRSAHDQKEHRSIEKITAPHKNRPFDFIVIWATAPMWMTFDLSHCLCVVMAGNDIHRTAWILARVSITPSPHCGIRKSCYGTFLAVSFLPPVSNLSPSKPIPSSQRSQRPFQVRLIDLFFDEFMYQVAVIIIIYNIFAKHSFDWFIVVLLQATNPPLRPLPQHQHGRAAPSALPNSDWWSSLPS